ncbi:hypothetical protein CRUP_021123 [Coryphaenoides rupestris]|nr:hypothetical protein CRUP_021123 [Coryphaenoides rupestris]
MRRGRKLRPEEEGPGGGLGLGRVLGRHVQGRQREVVRRRRGRGLGQGLGVGLRLGRREEGLLLGVRWLRRRLRLGLGLVLGLGLGLRLGLGLGLGLRLGLRLGEAEGRQRVVLQLGGAGRPVLAEAAGLGGAVDLPQGVQGLALGVLQQDPTYPSHPPDTNRTRQLHPAAPSTQQQQQ